MTVAAEYEVRDGLGRYLCDFGYFEASWFGFREK